MRDSARNAYASASPYMLHLANLYVFIVIVFIVFVLFSFGIFLFRNCTVPLRGCMNRERELK